MSWSIFSFLRKINVRAKEVHESDVWAEDVNEICDAIQQNNDDIQAIKNAQGVQTLSDAWPIQGTFSIRAFATNYRILDPEIYFNNLGTTLTPQTLNESTGDANYSANNPTHLRTDAVVADVQENISFIQGVPGPNPNLPDVPVETHFLIRYITITAAGTIIDPDTGIESNIVKTFYAENLGEAGGESNASSSDATVNVDSDNAPSGNKGIEATLPKTMDKALFNYTSVQNTNGATHISLEIELKAAVRTNRYWFIGLLKDGTRIGGSWKLFRNNQYGFSAQSLSKQQILIPLSETPFVDVEYDGAEIFFYHRGTVIPGYYLDNFMLLDGLSDNPNNPPSSNHTHNNKSVLDGITSSLITAWNNAYNWVTTNGANVLTNLANKQNSLATDGTGEKYPTVDAVNAGLSTKLDASAHNDRFKGKYLTLAALNAAHPTANVGDEAQVNEVGATDVVNYSWDDEENIWVNNGTGGSGATNTDQLPEGSSNLYFTAARVLATVLTGLSFATGIPIVATDTILVALGKLQKQITALTTKQTILKHTDAAVTGAKSLDWQVFGTFILTLTGPTTFSDANLPTGDETEVITIKMTGDIGTFPSYWTFYGDDYDETIWNKMACEVTEGDSGVESVDCIISNAK